MAYDPLNPDPFANGPFVLPVNAPGQTASLDIPSSYESRYYYNGPALVSVPDPGIIRVIIDQTAVASDTLDTVYAQGKATFKSITKDPVTGDDVVVTVTNPADIANIIAWLNGGTPQTLAELSTDGVDARTLNAIITPDMITEANSHTLQRLIEVNYIQTSNRLLTNALSSLDDALNSTQKILDTLSNIQNLHNKVTVRSLGSLGFNYSISHGNLSGYTGDYTSAASAYFGPPIFPDFLWATSTSIVTGMPGGGTFAAYAQELQTAKMQLGDYLSALTPPLLSGGITDPNSLFAKAQIVYENIPGSTAAPADFSAAREWALDKYNTPESNLNGAAQAGELQQQITFAITAGQALNDSLKEKVRRYMFVFEEYYKSASAMLSKISDLITKFAQGIRPS